MAEERDDSQRTEEPTQKRLQDAQEKGEVPKSQDLVTFLSLGVATMVLAFMLGPMAKTFAGAFERFLSAPHAIAADPEGMTALGWQLLTVVIGLIGLPLLAFVIASIAGNAIQHPPVFTFERLKWDFSKLSPTKGFQRLFGGQALVNFAKGLLKMFAVGAAGVMTLWPKRDLLAEMMTLDISVILPAAEELTLSMLGAMLAVLAVFAAIDWFWTRYNFFKKLRMSRQELKDEMKQSEGDPLIRSKIRQIRQERARKRMMAAVPTATVVITNPTHYAVALRYESGKMGAPVCVAKGVDALALRIRQVATDAKVPVIENPPLARALYATVEVDEEVPAEQYKAVAQVIGFVMRTRKKA